MIKIYLSASTQEKNVGVSNYGTEEYNMFKLRDLTEVYIKKAGNYFDIGKNKDKSMALAGIVNDSNKFNPAIHISFHSNAGSTNARGCECYYSMHNKDGSGKKLATTWYNEISKVTPSPDRGIKSDKVLYSNGLYELRKTNKTAVLMEFFFHSNKEDVEFFKKNINKFAEATAKAIYKFFDIKYQVKESNTNTLYRVYAGAYSNEENAKNQVKKLEAKGFDSYYKKETK